MPEVRFESYGRQRPLRPRRRSALATTAITVFLALFAAGGVFFGCIFFSTVADLIAEGRDGQGAALPLPSLPFVPKPNPTGVAAASSPQSAAQATSTPDPWAGVPVWQSPDQITILLLGLDMREEQRNQPTRSDTMILLTIDPSRKRAGMLSIPRDLWVPIPGHGENKINTAHFFGEMERPGGGPALAKQTVEYNLGVRVNYYARVDFQGFEELVDAIGGVTLDAERPVKDDEYPAGLESEGGITRLYIPTGLQHLNGRDALRYARSRHADNDFGRNQRQQQVLLAARAQVLQPSILPKVPQMLGILRGALQTDIPITDVLPLFNMARGIQSKDIVNRAIDYTMTIDVNGDGSVLVPDRKKMRPVVDEVFSGVAPAATPTAPAAAPTAASRATPTSKPTAKPTVAPTRTPTPAPTKVAPVAVNVYNGTLRDGLAAGVAEDLRAHGYVVKAVAQAQRSDYAKTVVQDHTGKAGVATTLAKTLGVPTSAVVRVAPSSDGADVTVILGQDAKAP